MLKLSSLHRSRWFAPSVVFLLLTLGAVLRFYRIGSAAIWWDEGYSHRWAVLPVKTVLHETSTQDFNPPLYYLMLNGWVRLFGDSEASMRAPSAICSLIAVWLTYLVARRLLDQPGALLATAAMAVSAYEIYYAQQARSYGLMVALSLASIYFFLRILVDRNPLLAIGYILTTATMLYAHVYGVFFLAVECLTVLAIWVRRSKTELTIGRGVVVQSGLLILLIPWVLFAKSRAKQADAGFWIERPTIRFIARELVKFTGSHLMLGVIAVLLILAAVAMVRAWRTPENQATPRDGSPFTAAGTIAFLFAWCVLPHLLPIAMSYVKQPIYVHRYAIGAMPAMFMLAIVGARSLRPAPVAAIAGGLFFAVLGVNLVRLLATPPDMAAKDLVQFVDATASPNDLLIFDGQTGGASNIFDYYSPRHDLHYGIIDWTFAPINETYFDAMRHLAQGYDCVWLITLDRPDKVTRVKNELAAEYPEITRYPKKSSLKHIVALRLTRIPTTAPSPG